MAEGMSGVGLQDCMAEGMSGEGLHDCMAEGMSGEGMLDCLAEGMLWMGCWIAWQKVCWGWVAGLHGRRYVGGGLLDCMAEGMLGVGCWIAWQKVCCGWVAGLHGRRYVGGGLLDCLATCVSEWKKGSLQRSNEGHNFLSRASPESAVWSLRTQVTVPRWLQCSTLALSCLFRDGSLFLRLRATRPALL